LNLLPGISSSSLRFGGGGRKREALRMFRNVKVCKFTGSALMNQKDHNSAAATPPPSSRTGEMSSDSRFKSFLTRGVSDMRERHKTHETLLTLFQAPALLAFHQVTTRSRPLPCPNERSPADGVDGEDRSCHSGDPGLTSSKSEENSCSISWSMSRFCWAMKEIVMRCSKRRILREGAAFWRPANAEHNQTFKSLWHLRKWK